MSYSATDIYYNVRQSSTEGQVIPVQYNDNRPSALVNNPSEYRMSVIQFSVSTDTLPALFVQHPTQAGPTPHETSYKFTLTSNATGNSFSEPILWTNQDPTIVQQTGSMDDPYWYCYNISYFVKQANDAISLAMYNLIQDDPLFLNILPPFFSFDPATCVCSLYTPKEFNLTIGLGKFYANELAYILFQGLPAFNNPTSETLTWNYDPFLFPDQTYLVLAGTDFIRQEQTPGAMSSWCPVKRVAFTTTSIPIIPEGAPPQTNPNSGVQGSGLNNEFVLTDITPLINRGDELLSGSLYYNPSAEYRWTDCISQSPLSNIDFSVFWVDGYGGFHRFYLSHGGSVQAKILFRKKTF